MSKTKALAKMPDQKDLADLQNEFPVDPGYTRVLLPRINFKAQDVEEGKGKKKKVVIEAGTFIEERETEDLDENGKKIWSQEELGDEIEGVIVHQRKQLRYYDSTTGTFTSSPVFDDPEEVIPLFCDKSEVHRGTPAELKQHYMFTDQNGKERSALEENRILYILLGGVDGDLMQLNLRGSSMFAFMSYARKTLPPAVLTTFNSEAKEKGSIEWNQMTFEPSRQLDKKEVEKVKEVIAEIKQGIAEEKAFFAAQQGGSTKKDGDEDEDNF